MPKKIRILYTIPNFKTAGSQYVVESLVKGIDKEKFEVFISVEKYLEKTPDILPDNNKLQHQITGSRLKDARFFARLLKQHKIDIVHSWDYKSKFVEVLGSRLGGVKYLYTKKNAAWSKRWFLKSVLSTHIAYDNPEMKQDFFNNFLLQNKVSFIPHGVDTSLFKPMDLPKKTTIFNICCIGNICENKNQLFLIESLKDLPSSIHLNLYGNADELYLKKIKNRVKQLNLDARVHFKGFVANSKLPEVLNQQDLFVLASKKEGLPVSILEALACGLPVLSSDSGGGAKYIIENENGGFVFNFSNSEKFNKIVKRLFVDKDFYEKKCREAVVVARHKFTLSKEILSYEELYEKIQ